MTPGAVLQLQRAVGNRAVTRLLSGGVIQRKTAPGEAEREPDNSVGLGAEEAPAATTEGGPVEAEAAAVEEDRPLETETILTATREPIQILGELHHIEYRVINGEIVPGIATTWDEVDEIYQELRRQNMLGAHPNVATYRSQVKEKTREVQALIRSIRNLSGNAAYQRRRDLGLVKQTLNAKIRFFINAAVAANSTVVAEVLGAAMPPITQATDVTNVTAANTYRYHTGTQLDPIPLTWYKPAASYGNIIVRDYTNAPPANVQLTPAGPNPAVTDSQGNVYTFGVNANNFAMGKTWPNTPRHGSNRQTQRDLNIALSRMNYTLSALNEDGDHVRDLGFGGADNIANYWPLNSVINRLAYMGWRGTYYLNYKTQQRGNGNWELQKAPLNSGTLVGKYFRIVAEQATANPAGNNTAASGSDTAWGTAGTVLAKDGTAIPEA